MAHARIVSIDKSAAEALRGATASEDLYTNVGEIAAANCSPETDQRGTAEYKAHLAKELTRRSLRRAVSRAQGQEA